MDEKDIKMNVEQYAEKIKELLAKIKEFQTENEWHDGQIINGMSFIVIECLNTLADLEPNCKFLREVIKNIEEGISDAKEKISIGNLAG